jgi:site-specific DNA-methyltransferase (adenine-specific)
MEIMKQYPDNHFDLAIVDPPYGINHAEIAGKQSGTQYGKAAAAKKTYTIKDWDKGIPTAEYFEQLFRVSKNQIIFGANYMVEYLKPSMGWIFWDKDNGDNGFSDGELAFTSFDKGLRKVKITWNGMLQYNMKNKEVRVHPTQKPIPLYRWILLNYATEGDKILDTHGGSMTIAKACEIEGFDLDICEIDSEYFQAGVNAFNLHKRQQRLF